MDLPDLRRRIDLWNDLIVNRLRDRARFPVNATIYRHGAIPIEGRPEASLLEFALKGLERYHASLGRFSFPDQQPLISQSLPESPIVRRGTLPSLPVVDLPVRMNLMRFYSDLIGELCPPGEDGQTFGEAAYMDAEILLNLYQRVNVGRFVAQVKLEMEPDLIGLVSQPAALRERLTNRERERAVITRARDAAARHLLNPDLFERVFRWVIDETIAIEVRYLQRMAEDGKSPT